MSVSTNSRQVTIQCESCLSDFETDKWSANHGLTLCSDCASDFADAMDYERQGG